MRGLLLAILLALLTCGATACAATGSSGGTAPPVPSSCPAAPRMLVAGVSVGDLVSGGQTRHYRLHVPKGYQPGGSLVFNFHGLGETTAEQELLSGTSRKADEAGFAVVYPEGRGSPVGWDAGPGPQGSADVDFVLALARKLESDLQVASHRIYATFADHPLER